jgi:tRNA pseudouridine55 synthase
MTAAEPTGRADVAGAGRVDGILNINKPAGMTSHHVVACVRRVTGQRKAGHAGTLDPMATGVLLVCVGQATRVTEYLMRGQKRYRATIRLGIATDTYDAEGTVTQETPSFAVARERVEEALATLGGISEQVPPPYSALHVAGQRLYRLARQGIAVQIAPRPVSIEAIDLVAWESPFVTLEIRCSPGTYVRSLAHDLGQMLDVGGHLTQLTRLQSGRWPLTGAISLEQLRAAVDAGNWTGLLHPIDAALQEFPRLDLAHEEVVRLSAGQPVQVPDAPPAPIARAYGPDGNLRALVQPSEQHPGWWQPKKVFAP